MTNPPPDANAQLVKRVLASTYFERSPKLRSFLHYICEAELSGRRNLIHEHAIGVEVFGRQPNYNPSEDSIVRSQARLLRQRLDEYFRTEGAHEPLRIVIPKGGYLPLFQENSAGVAATVLVEEPVLEPIAEPLLAKPRSNKRLVVGASLLSAIILLAAAWTLRHHGATGESASATDPQARFWTVIFNPKRRTLVVPADSTLILLEELSQRPVHLQDYLSRQYLASMELEPALSSLKSIDLADSQYTSIADLNLVSNFMRKLPQARDHSEIRYARDLSMSDAKESNLILIGGARANPWVELSAGSMNLYVDFDWKSRRNIVIDKQPSPGQPTIYSEYQGDPSHSVYGLIAFVPSLDRDGSILLVAGTSTTGTEAAADFLFNNPELNSFLARIQRPTGEIPHFEMLLQAESIAAKAPQSKVIVYRVLP